jgi:hypothetical protein
MTAKVNLYTAAHCAKSVVCLMGMYQVSTLLELENSDRKHIIMYGATVFSQSLDISGYPLTPVGR